MLNDFPTSLPEAQFWLEAQLQPLERDAARAKLRSWLHQNELQQIPRAVILEKLGSLERQQGELRLARGILYRSAQTYNHLGECIPAAQSLLQVAQLERQLGRFEEAKKHFGKVLEYAKEFNQTKLEIEARSGIAGVELQLGHFTESLTALQQTLELQRSLGDNKQLTKTLINTGLTYIKLGEYEMALRYLFDAHSFLKTINDTKLEITNLVNIGLAFEHLEDLQNAQEYYLRALEATRTLNDPVLLCVNILNLGQLDRKSGDFERAQQRFTEALGYAKESGFQQGQMAALDGLGQVFRQLNQLPEAIGQHLIVLEIAKSSQDREQQLEALLHLGRDHFELKTTQEALDYLHKALEIAQEVSSLRGQFEAHEVLSAVYEQMGQDKTALMHHQQFYALRSRNFNEERDKQTRIISARFDLERARNEAEVYRLRNITAQQARTEAETKVRQRTLELEKSQIEVVTRLAVAAEYRDDRTGEHTFRVGHYSALIAKQLGWKEAQVNLLRLAARLHDVGKIGIPDDILLKPAKLSLEEFNQMKQHTVIGSRILSGGRSKLLRMAERIAISHHEQWNGQGYPYNLPGEVIPLEGRIVAVADVYDALTQIRPYKRAWRSDEALRELERGSGTQFDPSVIQAAIRAFNDPNALELPSEQDNQNFLSFLVTEEDETFESTQPHQQRMQEQINDLEQARLQAEYRAIQLERQAYTDPLTNLNNRKAFDADFENELSRAQRQQRALHVVSIELDGIIITNERAGKGAGTQLLQQFAKSLEQQFAQQGRTYRISSSEFAVLIETTNPLEHQPLEQALVKILSEIHTAGFTYAKAVLGTAHSLETDGIVQLSQERLNLNRVRQHRQ
jgi:diguanylate cyclase (GGDEF)-like protein